MPSRIGTPAAIGKSEEVTLKDILESLPLPNVVKVTTRPCYVIVGRPGTGKTTLAQRLAADLNAQIISPEPLLNYAVQNEGAPWHQELHLRAFGNNSRPPGFVLEGLPGYLTDNIDPNSQPEDLLHLKNLLARKAPQHRLVLISLNISDHDLIRRRAAQWLDMETGIIYPGAQVVFSRKKWAENADEESDAGGSEEGSEAGQEEAGDDEESDSDNEENPDDEEGGEEDEDAIKKKKKAKSEQQIPLTPRKIEWTKIPMDVLERLIKRPEDSPDQVTTELYQHNRYEALVQDLKKEYFDPSRIVNLDASQTPVVLYKNLQDRLEILGFGHFGKAVVPKVLAPPEDGHKSTSDQDVYRYLSAMDLEVNEPSREVGMWGKHCSVTYVEEDNKLAQVETFDFAASYKGQIYFFADAEKLQKFLINPLKYLASPPRLSPLRIAVVGGPVSGKTTQSKLLASLYDLFYVSLDETFRTWDTLSEEEGTEAWGPIFSKTINKLRAGKNIPLDTQFEVVKAIVAKVNSEHEHKKHHGWVLDGFPRTLDQANAFVAANLLPDYTVILQNDINDEVVRSRSEIRKIDPATGHTTQAANGVIAAPYFDKLFNGFKEEFADIIKLLEEKGATTVNVPAENGIRTVLSTIQGVIDPFLPKATSLTAKMQAELPPDVPLGYTKDYCPHTLRESNTLIRGNKNFAVKYQSLYYYLLSDEAKTQFATEPQNYVNSCAPMKPPPPRLVFFGTPGTGKTANVQMLRETHPKIHHIVFEQYLEEFAAKQELSVREDIEYMVKENAGVLSPPIICDILRTLFQEEARLRQNLTSFPYASQGFILEHFPRSKLEIETMLKNNFCVDAFVNFVADAEIAARRVVSKMKKDGTFVSKGGDSKDKGDDDEPDSSEELETYIEDIDKEVSRITEIVSTIESIGDIPIIEIDASKTRRPVFAALKEKLRPFLEYRASLFSNGYKVNKKTADKLLELGVKDYSPFRLVRMLSMLVHLVVTFHATRKYCPVSAMETKYLRRDAIGKFPVVFRNHIYYLSTKPARERFLQNTLEFVNQPAPPPLVRPTVFVLGPPKSGKTTLSTAIAKELGLIWLDVPLVCKTLLDGEEVCSGVYEKVPLTTDHGSWTDIQIRKSKFYSWKTQTCTHMAGNSDLNDASIIELRNASYYKHTPTIQEIYESKYSNIVSIDGTKSKWAAKTNVARIVRGNVSRRQTYLGAVTTGAAAPIRDIGIGVAHLSANRSKYGDYCPVSLTDKGELIKAPSTSDFMAEHQGTFYKLAGANELQLFLANPEKYLEKPLQELLPIKRSAAEVKAMFPKGLELRGYCPVTYSRGPKSFESIIPGSSDLVVEYAGKLYAMSDSEALESFTRTPWAFSNLSLPKKLPPPRAPIQTTSLPLAGYLEQTVASTLTSALEAVGRKRPKYPYWSSDRSAIEYLAVWLKAHNPASREWVRKGYEERLKTFLEQCEMVKWLSERTGDTFVDPEKRDQNYDRRMEEFLSLIQTKGVTQPLTHSKAAI
ncbi:hypothetical protein DFS34DRAFT_592129 [Phlyctochytrium arcticum]|nr:hypothetical protein DFS34DRAFT_592129 [Phlyctochytrium arcticum]